MIGSPFRSNHQVVIFCKFITIALQKQNFGVLLMLWYNAARCTQNKPVWSFCRLSLTRNFLLEAVKPYE